jgi:hypothetical protein
MLNTITVLVNLIALGLSLWLGLYIVTRAPRRPISWLTAGTIWAMSLFHLYNVLAIHPPHWAGWPAVRPLAVLGLPLWVHASMLLRKEAAPLASKAKWLQAGVVIVTYLAAMMLAFVDAFSPDPHSEAGARYPLLLAIVVGAAAYFAFNLFQCRRLARQTSLRRIFALLLIGTVTTALGGVLRGLSVLSILAIPTVIGDGLMIAAVAAIGYAIARYDAFLAGQTINRDLLYSLAGVGLATALLDALTLLGLGHQATVFTLVLTTSGAIVTHALYDGLRSMLDRLFYRDQLRSLRLNLRALANHSGRAQPVGEHLHALLEVIGGIFRTPHTYLALRQPDGAFVVQAQIGYAGGPTPPAAERLTASAVTTLAGAVGAPTQLLAPLFAGETQIGALVLDPGETWRVFSDDDLSLLEDLAEQLASVMEEWRQQSQTVAQIGALAGDFRQRTAAMHDQILRLHQAAPAQENCQPLVDWAAWEGQIEECLRKLDDFAFLGEHALSNLAVVAREVQKRNGAATLPAERGKALRKILLAAIETLRPDGNEPARHSLAPRAWQPYIALVDPYVRNTLTREAWLRLDVSEKTFHRIRGRAIRAIAKTLYAQEQRTVVEPVAEALPQTVRPIRQNEILQQKFAKMTVLDSLRPCADSLSAVG